MALSIDNHECLKDECFLQINDFGTVSTYNGLTALARLVQRLFIMQPRSYPDDPEMGIGIETYQFEFMDKATMTDLTERATSQINKYIPNNNIYNLIIDEVENDKTGQKNTIGVLINFYSKLEGKENMILTFEKIGTSGKIDSKIYI